MAATAAVVVDPGTVIYLKDYLTLAALVFGPILGVGWTLWYQSRSEKRVAKQRLFLTLIRVMIGPKAVEYGEMIEILAADLDRMSDEKGTTFVHGAPKHIYVWGKAEYADVFGYAHWTKFCYRVEFRMHERDYIARFISYGDYNGTDLDTA